MKYSLYPGCAGEATTKEAWSATSRLLEFLGLDVTENDAYSCCGAGIVEEDELHAVLDSCRALDAGHQAALGQGR